jgi:hypothetical protein
MNNERYLVHHGILGQKWGVRRYQNYDGSLTPAGKARYDTSYGRGKDYKAKKKSLKEEYRRRNNKIIEKYGKAEDDYENDRIDYNTLQKADRQAHADEKASKAQYKTGVKALNKDYKSKFKNNYKQTGFKDQLVSGDGGRKRIATLLTNNPTMTIDEARSIVYKESAVNTAAILGAFGAYTVYQTVKNN